MISILTLTRYIPKEINIFSENDERIKIIKYALKKRLIQQIEEGVSWIITSGQMGVELWTAEVVLELKESYDVNLGVFPPFENFTSRWPEHLREKHTEISFLADHFHPLYKGDYKGPFQFKARDQWFLEKSDQSLILMDEEYPGSTKFYYDTIKDEKNHAILFITPFELEEVVEEMRLINNEDYYL